MSGAGVVWWDHLLRRDISPLAIRKQGTTISLEYLLYRRGSPKLLGNIRITIFEHR